MHTPVLNRISTQSVLHDHTHISLLLYHQSDSFVWPMVILSQFHVSFVAWVLSDITVPTPLPQYRPQLWSHNDENSVFATYMCPLPYPVTECDKHREWVFWIQQALGHYFVWCTNILVLSLNQNKEGLPPKHRNTTTATKLLSAISMH